MAAEIAFAVSKGHIGPDQLQQPPPAPHKDFSYLYEKMSGKEESAGRAHRHPGASYRRSSLGCVSQRSGARTERRDRPGRMRCPTSWRRPTRSPQGLRQNTTARRATRAHAHLREWPRQAGKSDAALPSLLPADAPVGALQLSRRFCLLPRCACPPLFQESSCRRSSLSCCSTVR